MVNDFMEETSRPKKKVLVVDDEESIAQVIRDFLEEKGYIVALAHNGADGYQSAVTGQPGLRNAPESIGLGWARDGRAVVELPQGVCGAGSSRPGVYLVDPASGKRTYVYRRSRFWRAFS